MRRRLSFARLLVLLLAPAAAVAGDPGRGLALDGICGGARLCDCGDSVVGSRTLVPGVDPITTKVCGSRGLEIFGRNIDGPPIVPVVLDLGGATIRGSGPSNSFVGVSISHSTNVTLTNGRITGFDVGLEVVAADATVVSGVQVVENRFGISWAVSDSPRDGVIEKCIVERNEWIGIQVGDDGVTVRLCQIERNGGTGLLVRGDDTVIARNVVTRNGFGPRADGFGNDGIVVEGARALVDRNQSRYNAGIGVVVDGTAHTMFNNVVTGNGADGFGVTATNSLFDRNASNANGGFGFADDLNGPPNRYERNRCTGNAAGKSSPSGLCF